MDEETLARLRDADWDDIAPRLLRYVRSRIGDSVLPRGVTAQDVVQMAVERLYSPKGRTWDPEKQPDLCKYMLSVLRSMLSSKGLYGIQDAETDEFLEEQCGGHLTLDGVAMDDVEDPVAAMDRATAFSLLQDEIKDDRELEDILAAIQMGCSKSKDIADMTRLPVKKVYELQRKMGRYAARAAERLARGDLRKDT